MATALDLFKGLNRFPPGGFVIYIHTMSRPYNETLLDVCQKISELIAIYFTKAGRDAIVNDRNDESTVKWKVYSPLNLNPYSCEVVRQKFCNILFRALLERGQRLSFHKVRENLLGQAIREAGFAEVSGIWNCFELDKGREVVISGCGGAFVKVEVGMGGSKV